MAKTTDLEQFFDKSQPEMAAAVDRAEAELVAARARVVKLERLVARGRAALGELDPLAKDLTLHRALELVLADADNVWMSAGELAQAVGSRGLYRMRDGRPVEAGQIHARVRNYGQFFEVEDAMIRLRYVFETSMVPATGAFSASRTAIVPAGDSDWSMTVEVRVSYSVSPPDGHSLESFASDQADAQAHRIISKETFVPGGNICYLLTTTGIQVVERSW